MLCGPLAIAQLARYNYIRINFVERCNYIQQSPIIICTIHQAMKGLQDYYYKLATLKMCYNTKRKHSTLSSILVLD